MTVENVVLIVTIATIAGFACALVGAGVVVPILLAAMVATAALCS